MRNYRTDELVIYDCLIIIYKVHGSSNFDITQVLECLLKMGTCFPWGDILKLLTEVLFLKRLLNIYQCTYLVFIY